METQAHAGHQATRSVARAAWPRPSHLAADAHDRSTHNVAVVRRIHHRWTDLFDLVLDLDRYPEFVPHCRAVRIFSCQAGGQDRTVIVSRMTVGAAGFDVSYANRTTGDADARRIEVKALDGPLTRLNVLWTFEPDGEEWTRVGFSVEYAFDSAILSAIASRAFDAMFGDILAAFERRADRLYA
jgi:coenzyme Q-binding protein COQ10